MKLLLFNLRCKCCSKIFFLSLFFIFISSSVFANDLKIKDFIHSYHIESENKLGNKRNIGSAKLLIPFIQDRQGERLIFFDLRGRLDNIGSTKYNLAIGYRNLFNHTLALEQKQWILGVYIFLDRFKSKYNNIFSQLTLGAEALSNDYDFRVNIYLPQNKEVAIANLSYQREFLNSNLNITEVKEAPLKGSDIEFGYRLPVDFAEAKLFIGGYYFSNKNYKAISGPRLRGELSFNNHNLFFLPENMQLSVGSEYQYDQTRKEQFSGLFKVSYRFGDVKSYSKLKESQNDLKNRMTDFLIRDVDIVTSNKKFFHPANYFEELEDKSVVVRKIYLINSDINFKAFLENVPENSWIIIDGSKGDFEVKSPINLQKGVKITNQNCLINIKAEGLKEKSFSYSLFPSKAKITAISNQESNNEDYIFNLNDKNIIADVDFYINAKAASSSANKTQIVRVLYINNKKDIIIKNSNFMAVNDEGVYKSYKKLSAIEINNSTQVKITNDKKKREKALISGYGRGIVIANSKAVTIDGINFSENQVSGVNIIYQDNDSKSDNILINNSKFSDNKRGIVVNNYDKLEMAQDRKIISNLAIINSEISNSNYEAILIENAQNLKLDEVKINSSKYHSNNSNAILISNSLDSKINNSTIVADSNYGLLFEHSINLNIENLEVKNTTKNGIYIKNSYGDIMINHSKSEGLYVYKRITTREENFPSLIIHGEENNFKSCSYNGRSNFSTSFKASNGLNCNQR
jgi:hypothetical protein